MRLSYVASGALVVCDGLIVAYYLIMLLFFGPGFLHNFSDIFNPESLEAILFIFGGFICIIGGSLFLKKSKAVALTETSKSIVLSILAITILFLPIIAFAIYDRINSVQYYERLEKMELYK